MTRRRAWGRAAGTIVLLAAAGLACRGGPPVASGLGAQERISNEEFGALVARISEEGGYFDTDNLISNETGYLNVLDALRESGLRGGAYVGVGPDQNYSYIAALRPELAIVTDVRKDNLLQHLLLKALVEASETPVGFLARLHGVPPPTDVDRWRTRSVDDAVSYVDSLWSTRPRDGGKPAADSRADVAHRVRGYGIPLTDEDLETIRRFHDAFIREGLALRFTSFGRPPRPYYPTYRQLVLETDIDGDQASWLSSKAAYDVVRDLHLRNRIVPVVGDLSGRHAIREIGEVLRESGLALTGFYVSNVEFYLWREGVADRWIDNVRSLPLAEGAVVIRSYFPNLGRSHPSAVRGYYATQSLQPLAVLSGGGFTSYWDLVTREALPLR